MKIKKLYKTFRKGFKSVYDNSAWKLNKWRKCSGEIKLCKNGFHASKRIIDAMNYVDCEALGLVEVRGKSDKQKDKEAWSEMRLIKKYKWTKKDSVAMAIYAAELCISNFEKEFPDDSRPRDAIEAAKKWLKNPTKKNQNAAWSALYAVSAAWSAKIKESVRSAKWSAMSAAKSSWSTAESARSAVDSAVYAAESAADSAAWSAESAAESAKSAAWSADSAAESARSAEESGGYEKTLDKIERWIRRRIK